MQYINVGEIGVNGYEFAFEATPLKTRDFSWFLKFNFSTSHQIVKKVLNNEPMVFYDPNDVLMPKFVIKEGAPLGDIYGYKVLGKWTSLDTKEKDIHYIKIGNEKFFNADTTIKTLNSNDMVVIGNSVPKYMWNLSTTFQYKDFTLDLTWYAVQGVKKYNATRAVTFMKGLNREINNYIKDSISALTSPYFYQSSEFIDNASFIRLKTVTLSYIPDKEFYKHVKLRLSISLENLFTITKYRGYDPEATTFTDNNFSDNAIDRGSVPNPKAMYATISIKF
jgi:hypothetical protein